MAKAYVIVRRNAKEILALECSFDKAESAETIANGFNDEVRRNHVKKLKGEPYNREMSNVYFTVQVIEFFRTITAEG